MAEPKHSRFAAHDRRILAAPPQSMGDCGDCHDRNLDGAARQQHRKYRTTEYCGVPFCTRRPKYLGTHCLPHIERDCYSTKWMACFAVRAQTDYMSSVTGFTLSSLLCGLAPNLRSLIFFRVLQGAAGGGLGPSEQSILVDTFPARTAIAFAVYSMVIVLAPTLGPTLGGYITDHFGWRWIFFINVPIGFVSLYLSNRMIVDPPYVRRARS